MRAKQLASTIKALFPIQRTVCIEGPPGGGKTSIVQQAARELGVHYIERHMPTMLVEDFGVPDMMQSGPSFGYKLPDWFPFVGSRYDDGKGGILCFDDRNQANADLQKVLANICQARNLHGKPLADGWMVVSTGNRQSDRAGANKVLSHLRNRETILPLETHLDDWCRWAADNRVRPEVIAFLRFRPELLHAFDPQHDVNPTPRSWVEGVSDVLGVVPVEAEYECFMGAVGEGPAAEITSFMKIYRQLPDASVVWQAPRTVAIPTELSVQYATVAQLAQLVDVSTIDAFATYLDRYKAAPVNRADFSILGMTMATKRDKTLQNTKTFTDWAIANHDVLF